MYGWIHGWRTQEGPRSSMGNSHWEILVGMRGSVSLELTQSHGHCGNSSHLCRYSQSVQVHHHHLCHQGDHLDPKEEGKRNKEVILGCEQS